MVVLFLSQLLQLLSAIRGCFRWCGIQKQVKVHSIPDKHTAYPQSQCSGETWLAAAKWQGPPKDVQGVYRLRLNREIPGVLWQLGLERVYIRSRLVVHHMYCCQSSDLNSFITGLLLFESEDGSEVRSKLKIGC